MQNLRTKIFSAWLALCGVAGAESFPPTDLPVGILGSNTFSTPVNQVLTPAGTQVELPGLRPQTIALSPDGKWLAASGKTSELLILQPGTGAILQRVPLPAEAGPAAVSPQILQPDKSAQVSFTGLIFGSQSRTIYLSSVNGSINMFALQVSGTWSAVNSFALPADAAPRRSLEIPAGLALSRDGRRLYVAGNLSNRLLELDATSGGVLRTWEAGVAPYEVALVRGKAYVSNWGGRRPGSGDLTGPAGRGTLVKVDPVRHIAKEGSVTVIDLSGGPARDILTGLHASAMAVSPDQRYLAVANAGSDTLSVIDTRADRVIETIWARQNPADLFGASPNALAFDAAGKMLYICNGTQNAVAVARFRPGRSELRGLIPVGWFPGAIAVDPRRDQLCVANIKGIGSGKRLTPGEPAKFASSQFFGTLSLVPIPSASQLKAHTVVALRNLRYPALRQAALRPRPNCPARPVPERVGEPSVFQHVVYIIKENRTYDQVLGDVAEGNGDPSLCVFGSRVTPNQHKLVREFVLLDNTYCSGILSADGHQWSTTAFATDYMEKSFAGFPRSYPDGMEDDDTDALAYSPAGFIWDNALAHGKSVRDYGEFAITEKCWKDPRRRRENRVRSKLTEGLDEWRRRHDEHCASGAVRRWTRSRRTLCTNTVGWDMGIPDVFRAAQFIRELREYERTGDLPNLILICLPNDHTSGTAAGSPTPEAHAADNDLAFGQIVEAISQSRFWKETCIFAIEDDPQNGWDHVSGYRTTAYVASPYTRRGAVVSTQYNQTSILRTIELILGLPPMNQMDATATPMFDCFTHMPDFRPFTAVPNNIPLDWMNPEPGNVSNPLLRKHAIVSARLPLNAPDCCPEDTLNRIVWHALKGPAAPYPEWAVTRGGQ